MRWALILVVVAVVVAISTRLVVDRLLRPSTQNVEFVSGQDVCRGALRLPRRSNGAGIVLAHGFGGTADCTSIVNAAEHFTRAGFATLVFDYRHFGRSDGMPRQKLSVALQREDYHAALGVMRRFVDHKRVGLWGTSFSGAHTLFVAKEDGNVAASVAQVPALDLKKSSAQIASHRTAKQNAELGATPEDELVKLVLDDDAEGAAVFMSEDSRKFKTVECPTAKHWVNGVLAESLNHGDLHLNDPSTYLDAIDTPTLVIVANRDELNSTPGSVAFASRFEAMSLVRYDCNHFGIYAPPMEAFAHADACNFFSRHL